MSANGDDIYRLMRPTDSRRRQDLQELLRRKYFSAAQADSLPRNRHELSDQEEDCFTLPPPIAPPLPPPLAPPPVFLHRDAQIAEFSRGAAGLRDLQTAYRLARRDEMLERQPNRRSPVAGHGRKRPRKEASAVHVDSPPFHIHNRQSSAGASAERRHPSDREDLYAPYAVPPLPPWAEVLMPASQPSAEVLRQSRLEVELQKARAELRRIAALARPSLPSHDPPHADAQFCRWAPLAMQDTDYLHSDALDGGSRSARDS
eukprot:scaffold796_cov43-Prasinocladus_malaysianus.AAC.1